MKLRIRRPCPLKSGALDFGDDATAFCGVCRQTVHDLSAGSEERAASLVARRDAGESVCVRYEADSSGNILFDRARTAAAAALLSVAPAALADGGDDWSTSRDAVLHELASTVENERRNTEAPTVASTGDDPTASFASNHANAQSEDEPMVMMLGGI